MATKICLVTPEYPPRRWGGLARTVLRVSELLAALGLEVHVVDYIPKDGQPPLLDENRRTERRGQITLHEIDVGRESFPDGERALWDCPHTLTLLMLFESLDILHRQERFDAFLSFFLYPTGYVVGLLARREHLPHIACVVGNDVKKYLFSPEKTSACRSGLENADRLVFLAEDLLALADALTPVRSKSRLIFNSVQAGPERWPGSRPDRIFTVGAAGIFKHAKGLPYLFKAAAMLRGAGEIRLEIAGETRPEEAPICASLLERFSLEDAVRFHGPVPHEAMPAWLSELDVFALPSVSEGCPNVLMEAMALGLPCVASRVGAVEELMQHGRSGLVVDWGDSAQLAQSLERLRSDPDLAVALGREASRRMTLFSPERERRAWEELVRELLSW